MAKEKAAVYQRRWRDKVKATKVQTTGTLEIIHESFTTSQSIGKAVKRVEKAMPNSPRKRVAVIGKMVSSLSPKRTQENILTCSQDVNDAQKKHRCEKAKKRCTE